MNRKVTASGIALNNMSEWIQTKCRELEDGTLMDMYLLCGVEAIRDT